MRIALTGATGLIGRNLLFEIIKQNLNDLDRLEILVLGRSLNGQSINQRIQKIIQEDGLLYLELDQGNKEKVIRFCGDNILGVSIDLEKDGLGLSAADFKILNSKTIDYFFHNAALTDLRDTPGIEKALEITNVFGTSQILRLVEALKKVMEFCYVGTAYSCGSVTGNVQPDVADIKQVFRNPYEKTKLQAELLVRNFAKKTKIRCRYFRPSVTCGRLIEPPLGAVSKYDVFYGWAAFFYQLKLKSIKSREHNNKEKLDIDGRVFYNLKSGLNIVPVDYAAKVMYQVCIQEDGGTSYHLVNNQETPHKLYIPIMLSKVGITGIKQLDFMPRDMTRFERIYYKTAGKVFTPYVTAAPMLFNVENLRNVVKKANLLCPSVDEKSFSLLMDYAKAHDFGIEIKDLVAHKQSF